MEFYESLKAMAKTAYDHGYGFTDEAELPRTGNGRRSESSSGSRYTPIGRSHKLRGPRIAPLGTGAHIRSTTTRTIPDSIRVRTPTRPQKRTYLRRCVAAFRYPMRPTLMLRRARDSVRLRPSQGRSARIQSCGQPWAGHSDVANAAARAYAGQR